MDPIIVAAADSLLDTHASTGIDLSTAPAWLALVALVYPNVVVEGTGPTFRDHVRHSRTETGRVWLHDGSGRFA